MSVETRMYAAPQARRPARRFRHMGLPLLLWACCAVMLVCFERDLVNLFFGPMPIDRETLYALHDPVAMQTYHVRLTADQEQRFFPSAYTLGQEPYSYYAVLDLGDKCLLVHLPARHTGNHYSGLLEPFAPYEKEFVLERCRAKNPGKELLPFRLNMTRPLWFTVFYFRIVPLILLLAAAVWQTARACLSGASSDISSARAGRADSASRPALREFPAGSPD